VGDKFVNDSVKFWSIRRIRRFKNGCICKSLRGSKDIEFEPMLTRLNCWRPVKTQCALVYKHDKLLDFVFWLILNVHIFYKAVQCIVWGNVT